MTTPLLSIQGLVKRFGLALSPDAGAEIRVVPALAGVDLDVGPGEHVVIAGPSGSGKSSLLRCVFRTYLPTSGRMLFRTASGSEVDLASAADEVVADLREREVGYVSQFLRAEPRRSALTVVAKAARRRGMGSDEALDAAADALRSVNISESLWASYPVLLSGGEQQRVNLASATVAPPRLLLLDEPVSALDPANREAVLSRIEDLARSGVALLSVFHDWDAIERLATRVVVLERGLVKQTASAGDARGQVFEEVS
jgi:alpha-D-ribose 1-methylphosphonate 5-triphosphate synthase subunit PhnL